jgi:hypothetical protein
MSAIEEIERQLLASVTTRRATVSSTVPTEAPPDAAGDPADRPLAPPPARRPRGRIPMGGWRILVLVGSLALVGGAATAATLLLGQRSAPLAAKVPPGQPPGYAVAGGYRYEISLVPALQTGQIGWCGAITTFSRSGARANLAGGCDAAPTSGSPLTGALLGEGLSFVFTTSAVRAVRPPGRRPVLTRSANLPFGYRAAVFEYIYQRGDAGSGPVGLTPLSSTGQVIGLDGSGMPVEPVRSWGPAARPIEGSCSLSAGAGAGLTFGVGSVVTSVIPAPAVVGDAFLPCIERNVRLNSSSVTTFPISERVMQAFVLLNAKDPTAVPLELPNLHTLPGRPGVYDNPSIALPDALSNGMTAKRVGHAWLTVVGGRNTQQRLAALKGLEVGPVVPRPGASPSASPGEPRCGISYRPVNALVETAQRSATERGICWRSNFYYRQRWPLTADLVLSTGRCQIVLGFPADCAPRHRRPLASRQVNPVRGHPDEYTVSIPGLLSALVRRLQRSWLIIYGGEDTHQQQLLLSRLSTTIAPSAEARLAPTATNVP